MRDNLRKESHLHREPGTTAEAPSHDPSCDIVGRGMAQWRRERPDIDCSGKAVVGRVLRLQDVILRAVNAVLARRGLRYPAYAALATLLCSGAPYAMSPTRLTETLLLSSGGTSRSGISVPGLSCCGSRIQRSRLAGVLGRTPAM